MGAPSDVVDRLRQQELEGTTFDIHEDTQDTVATFMALQTQWRVIAGMGGVVHQGINYAAVPAVLSLIGIPRADRPRVFSELRVMEVAALKVLNATKEDGQ